MPNYRDMYCNLAAKVDTAIGALIAALVECEKEYGESGEKLIELSVNQGPEGRRKRTRRQISPRVLLGMAISCFLPGHSYSE